MINKVVNPPNISTPTALGTASGIAQYLTNLYQSVKSALMDISTALNALLDVNNATAMAIQTYAKASLPSATGNAIIIVTDDVGGLTLAFSDGTNWRRVQDRNIIS